MEEDGGGFNDRVDKIFGSISSSSKSSLWSLTDAQIERRVWNKSSSNERRDDDQTPLSSSFFNHNHGEEDLRDIIGLDPTLDNEEEEDEFDKFAQGKENQDDDRLFMKDVTQHGPYLNSHHLLHHPPPPSVTHHPITINSILKRKTDELPKLPKRVRFDPTCKPNHHELHPQVSATLPQVSQQRSVPDYILNPSNYTRYDFHHHSLDHDVNSKEQLKKSKYVVGLSDDESSSTVLPKSVLFIPRKKQGDTVKQQQSIGTNAISIPALQLQQQEVDEMQQTEQETHVCTKPRFQTPRRQYRSKMEEDDTVC